jgi:hypothetical protein
LIFTEIFEELKRVLTSRQILLNDRILRNYATILAPLKILNEKIDCRIDYEAFFARCTEWCIKQTEQVSLGDSLATFWNMLSFLIDKHEVTIGMDFKIESHTEREFPQKIQDRNGNFMHFGTVMDRKFVGREVLRPTEKGIIKLMYLRLGKIHPLYLEAHRKQYGINGVDLTSITHYLSNNKAYVGFIKSTRFEMNTTSAYVFDYDVLDLDLERVPGSTFKEEKAAF